MKYTSILSSTALFASTLAATVPSEPWKTLTPTGSAPTGATSDYSQNFGIQIKTIAQSVGISSTVPESVASGNAKRDGDVNQIGDGQIQHQTAAAEKPAQTASVINQIGDGQIQHQTAASVVNQIGDGQIQHQTAASVVNQIGDGQIQHQTGAESATPTASVAAQINDGQVQQTGSASSQDVKDDKATEKSCLTDNSLGMTLKDSILYDGKGRVGAIVSNRQFQFDGPPPQAGSIFAAGWSITKDGLLALGDKTIFYECKSGDFSNLYDESIAPQCSGVHLSIVDLVKC